MVGLETPEAERSARTEGGTFELNKLEPDWRMWEWYRPGCNAVNWRRRLLRAAPCGS
jgi:hypothetical protein